MSATATATSERLNATRAPTFSKALRLHLRTVTASDQVLSRPLLGLQAHEVGKWVLVGRVVGWRRGPSRQGPGAQS